MDHGKMSNEDLLEAMRHSIAVADEEFEGHIEIARRILSKKMSGVDFTAAQRAGFKEVLPLMLETYGKGYYFGCQGLDFLSCLMLTKVEVERDQRRWSNLQGAALALGKDREKELEDVTAFAASRVMLPYATRRLYLTMKDEIRADMSAGQRKSFESNRDAFAEATKKWGWRHLFDGPKS